MLEQLSNVWPEWHATDKVGEGSYGKVYRCVRNEYGIESVCAIKVISIPNNGDGVEDMRFEGLSEAASWAYLNDIVTDFSNEIKVMEMLKNAPNIVSVENYKIIKRTASLGWDIYIRMEFLTSFPDYATTCKMTETDVLRLGKDICSALSICAKKGIIHRDIKPDNIFIDEYGNFKLGDFGVARKLEKTMDSMSRKGTYSYMAPEVYREEHYDTRADIYSLGTVMYKLLNNNRDPFIDAHKAVVTVSERSAALSRRRKGEPLPPPAFASSEVARIILKACEFNPDNRYDCVEDFRRDIINALKSGTEYFGPPANQKNSPEPKKDQSKTSGKIKIFEIDHLGDNEEEAPDPEKSILVHIPTKHTKTNAPEETKIFSAMDKTKSVLNENNVQPVKKPDAVKKETPKAKAFRPMDRESELPPKKQAPAPVPPAKMNMQKSQQAKPPVSQVIKPQMPVQPQIEQARPKAPPKKKISGATIAKIIAVVVIIGAAVAAAAYFIPQFLQDAKDAETNADKTVEYTKKVESDTGYNVEIYNSDDVCFEIEKYNEEGEIIGSIEYIYDDEGNEIGYKEYDKNGKMINKETYEKTTS